MTAAILYEVAHCLIAAGLALWLRHRALARPDRPALWMLTAAAACLLLGDVYWLAHLIVRGGVPGIFSACDVAYIGFFLLLNAALPQAALRSPWTSPFAAGLLLFTLLNAVGWIVWTDAWFANVVWALVLLALVWHAAMLTEDAVRPRRRNALLALLCALALCEALLLCLPDNGRSAFGAVRVTLWLLALFQLGYALKGDRPLARMPSPAWLLVVVFGELASFLSQGWVYYGFQVLTIGAFVRAVLTACGEEERHAD